MKSKKYSIAIKKLVNNIKETGELLNIMPNTNYKILISHKDYDKTISDDLKIIHIDALYAMEILHNEIKNISGGENLDDAEQAYDEYIRHGRIVKSAFSESDEGRTKPPSSHRLGDQGRSLRSRRVTCTR